MRRIFSAKYSLEAHEVQLFLESHGIAAEVLGDFDAFGEGFAFTPASEIGVYVPEHDFDKACILLDESDEQAKALSVKHKWSCKHCGQLIDGQFDACWNCGLPRGDAPSIPDSQLAELPEEGDEILSVADVSPVDDQSALELPGRSSFSLWIETLVVLALTLPIYGGRSVSDIVWHSMGFEPTFLINCFGRILLNGVDASVVLAAIYWSREPWTSFGIRIPPDWIDLFSGFPLYYAELGVKFVGRRALYQVLVSLFGTYYVSHLIRAPATLYHPGGPMGIVAMFGRAMSIGLAEELIMRGYLIPRLERLLRSTWSSVFVTAGLFALLHSHQGVFGVWSAFLSGLVSGSFFALTRRLWPLVLAHGIFDFIVMLNSSV
jgi:membrane protease YdiL (CAAX protease family)